VSGVEDPGTVDLITVDANGTYRLIMIETRPWDPSSERLTQLSIKVHNYVSFALDGDLTRTYPEAEGMAVGLQLDCVGAPDAQTQAFIDKLNKRLVTHGLALEVNILAETEPPLC
jgi:hypothetical protein